MTDAKAFELGVNIATTPGKVVFRNELIELIQYAPSTQKVCKRPLLIVPPWINKFYILDLREKNSFIKWCVDQGMTTFVVSWVNPDAKLADAGFDRYLTDGTMAALDAIEQATGESEINAVGYCLGGTLLAATLGYMAAKKDKRIASATFMTVADRLQADRRARGLHRRGAGRVARAQDGRARLSRGQRDGEHVQHAARERPDLVVRHQQLPARPRSVPVRPAALERRQHADARAHAQLLPAQHVHEERAGAARRHRARRRRRSTSTKVTVPTYFVSAIEDHIAPWKATYGGPKALRGTSRFVLSGSGHIAGIVNPPVANKYGYWTNDKQPESADEWLEDAKQHEGSWWVDWRKWLTPHLGKEVPARIPGKGKLKALEDAPGTYVKIRAER